MMPQTQPASWATDAHDFAATNYPSLVLVVVVLIFASSTIIIGMVCCSVVHAFTHRFIYRLDAHHTTKKSSRDIETGFPTATVDCLVSAKTEGSRFCTTVAVPTMNSQESDLRSNPPTESCHDGPLSIAVDLIPVARNSRLLYALPEENSNSCADDISPSSHSSAMEDDVFVLINQSHGQRRPFHSEQLSDTSNDHSNTDQQDLSQQHTTYSNPEHHNPLWQHCALLQPYQTGNTSNVLPLSTNPGDKYSNRTRACSRPIHSNRVQSNNRQNTRPASLDWKSFLRQSSESTKNWNSETLVANSAIEQTEKYRHPMRMCLAEVGIAKLFPFCDSDKAKMVVIAKQTITLKYANCQITNPEPQNEIT